MTREQWLETAIAELRVGVFSSHPLPNNIRVSCGFPSKGSRSSKSQRIGECWDKLASSDDHYEIFISPVLADPLRVLDVLSHEICHVIAGY
jgi:hypothetical protein